MENIYLTIVLAPLIGAIIVGLAGHRLGRTLSHSITILGVTVSTVLALYVFNHHVLKGAEVFNENIYTWMQVGGLNMSIGFLVDNLTSVMLLVVSFVSLMVHIYTIGYMQEDEGYTKFFSYISLFTFAMFMLVISNNFMQLFFGWEAVGLVSYLLIGFWHHKESAVEASLKAFLVNRVGDFGFLLGIAVLLMFFGTLDYVETFTLANQVNGQTIFGDISVITVICLLLFIGAMGKSAQVPLHVWLPGSMEGPTPISALIHAATMVTAGIFMVSRMSPIFELSDVALTVMMVIGAITAIFMGLLGIVQNDIKRVVAYSTLSQLGYMTVALGVSAYSVAIFHLMTHAFFKALLFLGSGCVIHSFNNEQDIRSMGGVWKKIPFTYVLMIIGTLALTGFPFLSGYYSKDAIIEFAYLRGSTIGYFAAAVGIFTALLTAIYSWRLIFKTFHGKYNNEENNLSSIHESPLTMLIPSCLLAIGAILTGILFKEMFIGYDSSQFWSSSILFLQTIQYDHPPIWLLVITPTVVIITIPIAYYLFVANEKILKNFVLKNQVLYNFLVNKWYFDELYNFIFVEPLKKIGLFFWRKGDINTIDRYGPDGLSRLVKIISDKAVHFQSGYLYHYAFVMLIGFSILLTYLILY